MGIFVHILSGSDVLKIAKYTSGFALVIAILSVVLITVGETTKQGETKSSSTSVLASTLETTQKVKKIQSTVEHTVVKNTTVKQIKTQTTEKTTHLNITKSVKTTDNEYEVPNLPDFKSWTNYYNVLRDSPQWGVLTSEGTYTDDNGFRRKGEDYLVAMGNYYTKTLGERFRITTNKGKIFTVTICDWKDNCDTDSKGQYTLENNCIIEFYVGNNLCKSVQNSGSCSSVSALSGKVIKIEKIK